MYSKSEGIVISFKFGQFENSSGVTLENVPKIIRNKNVNKKYGS